MAALPYLVAVLAVALVAGLVQTARLVLATEQVVTRLEVTTEDGAVLVVGGETGGEA